MVQKSLEMCNAHKLHTFLGGFGQRSVKPTTLYLSHPLNSIRRLQVSRSWAQTCVSNLGKKPLSKYTPFVRGASVRKTGMNKRGWVTATREQKGSEEYPREFCNILADIILPTPAPSHGA